MAGHDDDNARAKVRKRAQARRNTSCLCFDTWCAVSAREDVRKATLYEGQELWLNAPWWVRGIVARDPRVASARWRSTQVAIGEWLERASGAKGWRESDVVREGRRVVVAMRYARKAGR
jgi:hypothetical protein